MQFIVTAGGGRRRRLKEFRRVHQVETAGVGRQDFCGLRLNKPGVFSVVVSVSAVTTID